MALIDKDNTYHFAPNVAKVSLLNKNETLPDFYAYVFYFYKNYIIDHSTTTTQSALSMEKIRQIKFAVPPRQLQEEFVLFAHKSEESKAAMQASLDSLSAVYKKIIAENLGGSN